MTSRVRWLAVAGGLAVAAAPFACGGAAFEAGPGDGGTSADGAIDGAIDGPGEGATRGDGSPSDVASDGLPVQDGPSSDVVPPPVDGGESVTGTVVDQYLVPMAGVDVHSQMQKVTTATDGTFTLTGITPPYILTVVTPPAGGHRHGYVFQNATRKAPTLQLTGETAGQSQVTSVSGHLAANGDGVAGIVFADLPPTTPAGSANSVAIATSASNYSGPVSWFGPASVGANLYVLEWIVANGNPTGYIAYTSQMETLTSGNPFTWDTPASSSITVDSLLSATLGVSGGYAPTALAVFARPQGAQIAAPIAHVTTFASGTGSVTTPDIPDMTFVACGVQAPIGSDGGANEVFGAACATGLSPSAQTSLALPAGPVLVSPPSVATIGTTFSYQALTNGVYLVAFAPTSTTASAGDTFYVVTTDSEVKLPDLSNLGFQLPSGSTYAVEVYAFAPFASIDAALSPSGFSSMATDLHIDQGPLVDGQVASSGIVTFQVQ